MGSRYVTGLCNCTCAAVCQLPPSSAAPLLALQCCASLAHVLGAHLGRPGRGPLKFSMALHVPQASPCSIPVVQQVSKHSIPNHMVLKRCCMGLERPLIPQLIAVSTCQALSFPASIVVSVLLSRVGDRSQLAQILFRLLLPGVTGGIIGPYLIGYLSDNYSYGVAMTTLGAFNLAAALLFGTFPGASKADKEASLAAEQSTAATHPTHAEDKAANGKAVQQA